MQIFSEYKNSFIVKTIELVNRINAGEQFNKKSIVSFMQDECANDPLAGEAYIEALLNNDEEIALNIFKFDDEGHAELQIPKGIEVLPAKVELVWLWNMVRQENAALFLGDRLCRKLLQDDDLNAIDKPDFSRFVDIPNRKWLPRFFDDEGYCERFELIMQAILHENPISFVNHDRAGRVHKTDCAYPLGIEYSILDGLFRVSLWLPDDDRPIKANLERLTKVHVLPESFNAMAIAKVLELRKAKEPIVVSITNNRNSIERAAWLFSSYERKTRFTEDKFIVEIYHYLFDEEELIQNILSFGIDAYVLSPKHIQLEVRNRILIKGD